MKNNSRRSSIVPPKDKTRLRIEKMEAEREARRKETERRKRERAQEHKANVAAGNPGDVDFIGMVRQWRSEHAATAHDVEPAFEGLSRLCVCVRKRPLNDKERDRLDHDAITCINPYVWVHAAKTKVDGITKYLDHFPFCFDQAYGETSTTDDVYKYSTYPLLSHCCKGQGIRATVFCYGQTGSGKTFTMNGIQEFLCDDLFTLLNQTQKGGVCSTNNTQVMVSFFEFYGGHAQDLLNERQRLKLLEDGKNEIVVVGLREVEATDADHLKLLLEQGHLGRTTHQTEANDTSSRSHAICQICLKERKKPNKLLGKISLVDLAGSERGSDTRSHNAQRRLESAEINTSLHALKECIRAIDQNSQTGRSGRVPYRDSKLTLLLKDCFTSAKALTTMIATVSPGAASADHTINTLRYADRIKEKRVRKTPQRSKSASASPQQRPMSLSPRRPVDSTNHQHKALNRRASSLHPVKSSLQSKPLTRSTRSNLAAPSGARVTRSTSARNGLQQSSSNVTAGSTDSRLSYRSAPASTNVDVRSAPSRSLSAASSADDELDSLLDDEFDMNLSQESGTLIEPPMVSKSLSDGGGTSNTLFEPKAVQRSRSSGDENSEIMGAPSALDSQSDDDSRVVDSDDALFSNETRSSRPNGKVLESSEDRPGLSLQEMEDNLREEHMKMVEANAMLISRESQIQSEVSRSGGNLAALDDYVLELERILNQRESMIKKFQDDVAIYEEAKSKQNR